jgi:hypothetical protein
MMMRIKRDASVREKEFVREYLMLMRGQLRYLLVHHQDSSDPKLFELLVSLISQERMMKTRD